jgi:hypothetical protein
MKFFVQQRVTWQDGSESVKLFDINSESRITVATVKMKSKPVYTQVEGGELVEKVFFNGVEQKDDSAVLDPNRKIEYVAKIKKVA